MNGKAEPSDTSSVPSRVRRAPKLSTISEYGIDHDDLVHIRQFFPFCMDIVGEVVEIATNPTQHGKKNIAKSTKHTIAELQNPEYLRKKLLSKSSSSKLGSPNFEIPKLDNLTQDSLRATGQGR